MRKQTIEECSICHTIEPKRHEYPEGTKELAIKMYYGGVSGRSVGKILGMNSSNVMDQIKKALRTEGPETISTIRAKTVELDESYWFLAYKLRTETRENVYLMTMVHRTPRQIVEHVVSRNRSSKTIQRMVDAAPEAEHHCTDGHSGYLDVVDPGRHIYTFTIKMTLKLS